MTAVIYNNKGECERIIRGVKYLKHLRLDDGRQVFRFVCQDKSKRYLKVGYGTFAIYEDAKPNQPYEDIQFEDVKI